MPKVIRIEVTVMPRRCKKDGCWTGPAGVGGFHRLFKADLTVQRMITVKKVPEHLLDSIACR